jgi:uncharacterized protein (DUF486 family)
LPSLNINMSASGANLFVSWPTNAFLTYTLQSATNVLSSTWLNVTNLPVMTNGAFRVTVPVTSFMPATFYRLEW